VDEDADRLGLITVDDAAATSWALFESIPEMVVVIDVDGVIRYANKHCGGIVGWAPVELIGRPIETLLPDRPHVLHPSHRAALHRSGREVPVEVALSPLGGEAKATVATVRDVTERIETAALLAEAQTLLEVLDDRDRIARELHDSVIQSLFAAGLHLQAAADRPDSSARVSAVVDEIDEAIREIRGVIFTLHRPSALDSGLEAALRASIDEASRMLGHHPTLRLGGILINIPDELGAELLAVLREAMMNVAKHAHASKTEVSLDVGAEAVTLIVHDDGVGIDEAALASAGGLGIRNITERAERLGGRATFAAGKTRGAHLHWTVPRRA
jgi:signal transduction histidine kinase